MNSKSAILIVTTFLGVFKNPGIWVITYILESIFPIGLKLCCHRNHGQKYAMKNMH